jgi:hypothetical protein
VPEPAPRFDPLAILAALDSHRVAFVIVGSLARIIHGADEVADSLEVVPSLRADNLKRLDAALAELHAAAVRDDLTQTPGEQRAVATSAGDVALVPAPAGTRGYDDLRRGVTREPLGGGVRAPVASLGDLIRMLAAVDRADTDRKLRSLRRLADLDRSRDISR